MADKINSRRYYLHYKARSKGASIYSRDRIINIKDPEKPLDQFSKKLVKEYGYRVQIEITFKK
jgi:hypothetical protein